MAEVVSVMRRMLSDVKLFSEIDTIVHLILPICRIIFPENSVIFAPKGNRWDIQIGNNDSTEFKDAAEHPIVCIECKKISAKLKFPLVHLDGDKWKPEKCWLPTYRKTIQFSDLEKKSCHIGSAHEDHLLQVWGYGVDRRYAHGIAVWTNGVKWCVFHKSFFSDCSVCCKVDNHSDIGSNCGEGKFEIVDLQNVKDEGEFESKINELRSLLKPESKERV